MSWFGKKKEEAPIKKDTKLVDIPTTKTKNLIYKGPMSGMKEALDKWNKENKQWICHQEYFGFYH